LTVWFDLDLVTDEHPSDSGDWVTEHRYRAVLQVLEGVPKTQVAREFGTSRQSVHSWVARYQAGGLAGLVDGTPTPHLAE
jgi:transposase-like protein